MLFHCFPFQHQQWLALFNRIKFTRLLLTALIAFTKKEVRHTSDDVNGCHMPSNVLLCLILSSEFDHMNWCLWQYQTSSVGEAQKLVAQAADLLSAIHSSIQHGIQSQNDTTKGGNS